MANAMNDDFYRRDERQTEEDEVLKTAKDNPELFKQFMAFMSSMGIANKTQGHQVAIKIFLSNLQRNHGRARKQKKFLAILNDKNTKEMPFAKRNLTKGKSPKNRMDTAFHWHPLPESN